MKESRGSEGELREVMDVPIWVLMVRSRSSIIQSSDSRG